MGTRGFLQGAESAWNFCHCIPEIKEDEALASGETEGKRVFISQGPMTNGISRDGLISTGQASVQNVELK